MENNHLSSKQVSGLEQQTTQLLKSMRSAKLSDMQIYEDLQAFEKQLAEIRRKHFDNNNAEYVGY